MGNKQKQLEQLLRKAKVSSDKTTVSEEFRNNLKEHLFISYLEGSQKNFIVKFLDRIRALSIGMQAGFAFLIVSTILVISFYSISLTDKQTQVDTIADNGNVTNNLQFLSQITHIEGEALLIDQDGNEVIAEQDTEVNQGDTLITDSSSMAEVQFQDGSTIRLSNDTTTLFNLITDNSIDISLISGKVYNRISNNDSNSFIISSNDISIDNKSVTYTLESNAEKTTLVALENDLSFSANGNPSNILVFEKAEVNNSDYDVAVSEITESEYKSDFLAWNRNQDTIYGYLFDIIPPTIDITSPENGSSTNDTFIAILGMVSDSSNLRKVIINNIEYMAIHNGRGFNPEDGSFNVDVPLEIGDNTIDIYAYDKYWNESTESLVVNRNNTDNNNNQDYEVIVPTSEPEDEYLQLTSAIGGCTIKLNWQSSGYDVSNGYKVFYGINPAPTGPGSTFYGGQAVIDELPSEEYYVGVCVKNSQNGCSSPITYWQGTVSVSSSCQ